MCVIMERLQEARMERLQEARSTISGQDGYAVFLSLLGGSKS